MEKQRIYKTIEVMAKSGRVYRRPPNTPAPKFRGQRFTLLKGPGEGWATTRLTLTRAQYEQVQEASADVARAVGHYPTLSVGDVIIMAAAVSSDVLAGRTFTPAVSIWHETRKKLSGRRPKFKGDIVNVVLVFSPRLAEGLSGLYDRYCELNGVAELPRTGPVWAAFLHGVEVIRQALGSAQRFADTRCEHWIEGRKIACMCCYR